MHQSSAQSTSPRPWQQIPIVECGEALVPLPPELLRLKPHPYATLGAPYGSGQSPFALRQGVVERLVLAQRDLHNHACGWQLAIFDGWRPLAVQRFMVEHTIAEACQQQGVANDQDSVERDRIVAEVGRFWAPPSDHAATPPPHSTGAAVDLTLATADGSLLPMGGAIDAIGAISEPDHYADQALRQPGSEAEHWHKRRRLLAEVMAAAGFVRHPNEWWHFSWGDQLWAWLSQADVACYGRVESC